MGFMHLLLFFFIKVKLISNQPTSPELKLDRCYIHNFHCFFSPVKV